MTHARDTDGAATVDAPVVDIVDIVAVDAAPVDAVDAVDAATVDAPTVDASNPTTGGGVEEFATPASVRTSDRIKAYRAHLISAAAALVVLVVLVLWRRGGHTATDDTIDLGDWHLVAEPVDEHARVDD